MKILQVIFNLASGGAERFVVDLSNELSKTDEVVLMTLMNDQVNPESSQFYRPFLDKNVTYKNLGIKWGGGFSFKVLWHVYRSIKAEKADIIHIHVETIVGFCILAILFLCWKVTIVQTIHNDFHKCYSTIIYKLLFNTIGRLKKMRWAALSQTNYDEMIADYPFLIARRIDNGRAPMAPTEEFDSVQAEIRKFKKTDKTKVFLHVARCAEVKNQQMLVSAFNKFTNNGNDAILLVIGTNFDSELGYKIQDIAGDSIYFLGTRLNISDYMLSADCFCLSSSYEGLPITILEALLSGTPIVSTPIKGAVDVIKNNVTGVLSKDFTEEEYLIALQYANDHLIELQKLSQAEKVTCPYSIEACAKKYIDFYNEKVFDL